MTGEIDNLNLGSFIRLEFILSDVEGFPIFFANAFPTAKRISTQAGLRDSIFFQDLVQLEDFSILLSNVSESPISKNGRIVAEKRTFLLSDQFFDG